MICVLEKAKSDIARSFPEDQQGYNLINDCLHHFCWKLYNKEIEKEKVNEIHRSRHNNGYSEFAKSGN